MNDDLLLGQGCGRHPLAKWVDHKETYGPHVIQRFISHLKPPINTIVDLGAGSGRDLAICKEVYPGSRTIAIEAGHTYAEGLHGKVDEVHILNVERDTLPFSQGSVDLFIANQILEHTKEIFWIFDQITRSLRMGGYFIFGVPNIASLHNRLLLLFGGHPTQHKMCSGHVRPFSKKDTLRFLTACFPEGYRILDFAGSQFYPLPALGARIMADIFPTMAFSIFFLIQKQKDYSGEFSSYPARAGFETNFWSGGLEIEVPGQY
jgi:SAM-dependent methyltransferase